MLKDVYLARLERLYGDYLKTVQDLEDSRKLGEGMFGFKGGPADNPCHDRFVDELRALLEDFAAQEPASADVREVMRWIFDAPKRFPRPKTASWMLLAVHGLTGALTAWCVYTGMTKKNWPVYRSVILAAAVTVNLVTI